MRVCSWLNDEGKINVSAKREILHILHYIKKNYYLPMLAGQLEGNIKEENNGYVVFK